MQFSRFESPSSLHHHTHTNNYHILVFLGIFVKHWYTICTLFLYVFYVDRACFIFLYPSIFLTTLFFCVPITFELFCFHIFTLSLHGSGLQRRRLIPAPLPDTSSLGKSGTTGQWVDLPPMSGPLKEPFEIKVYEIDDVERLQRRRQEKTDEVSMGFRGGFF